MPGSLIGCRHTDRDIVEPPLRPGLENGRPFRPGLVVTEDSPMWLSGGKQVVPPQNITYARLNKRYRRVLRRADRFRMDGAAQAQRAGHSPAQGGGPPKAGRSPGLPEAPEDRALKGRRNSPPGDYGEITSGGSAMARRHFPSTRRISTVVNHSSACPKAARATPGS